MEDAHSREGKSDVVVITGGTAGIGRATAREFAAHGARVAVLARGEEGLRATQKELEELAGRGLALMVDVADPDAVRRAAARIERELGPIDIWINNAMTTVFGAIVDIAPEEYRRVTDVTYHGVVWGTMAALERMRPRRRGAIVQVGSALAYRGIPLQSAYCGAKHAAKGFTDSLRTELIHDDIPIHVTSVELPGVNTPQFDHCRSKMPRRAQPVPPIYEPEVAARAIYKAAYRRRRDIYVGRATFQTIWGNAVAPGILDRYLARRAFEGQQTDEPSDPRRPGNLFAPVSGDHGARGRFEATDSSVTGSLAPIGAAGFRAAAFAVGALALAALGAGLHALES